MGNDISKSQKLCKIQHLQKIICNDGTLLTKPMCKKCVIINGSIECENWQQHIKKNIEINTANNIKDKPLEKNTILVSNHSIYNGKTPIRSGTITPYNVLNSDSPKPNCVICHNSKNEREFFLYTIQLSNSPSKKLEYIICWQCSIGLYANHNSKFNDNLC